MLKNEGGFVQYDISVIPNDFNVNTIVNMITAHHIEMPVYQRNYVWDKKEASRFIESLILGLPVPQLFLYQKEKNKFAVIDGQQRLFSLYYFINQRFPKKEARVKLRKLFAEHGHIPDEYLHDNNLFDEFSLHFDKAQGEPKHPLQGLKFSTLKDNKEDLSYATIRCMAIRQNSPEGDDSSVFEIFNRLNTGGIKLTDEEIRASLYHSPFYNMLHQLNEKPSWRKLWGSESMHEKAKDVDALLRIFSILLYHQNYSSPMKKFLNASAKRAMKLTSDEIDSLKLIFDAFITICSNISRSEFLKGNVFNLNLFETVFFGATHSAYERKDSRIADVTLPRIAAIKAIPELNLPQGTAHTKSVHNRLSQSEQIFQSQS